MDLFLLYHRLLLFILIIRYRTFVSIQDDIFYACYYEGGNIDVIKMLHLHWVAFISNAFLNLFINVNSSQGY